MIKRILLPISAAALAAVALTAGPVTSAGAARTCTASDLQGSRAPAMLRDHGLDTQDGPLIAGSHYRVVVVQELANGDNARPVDGSIAITAPDGPALQPTTEDERPAYSFTPAGAGKVRLVVSWQDEVGDYGSGDICAASQAFDIPVVERNVPRVKGSFSRGRGDFGSSFRLRLVGKAPQKPGKVTVLLRARRGTTKPPAPRGPVLGRYPFKPSGSSFIGSGATRRLSHTFQADQLGTGVEINPYPNIAFGRTLRFSFSFEVIQAGHRIGGMRAGATCRRIQFAQRSGVKCKAVVLKLRP
jgi:hypothetical protein